MKRKKDILNITAYPLVNPIEKDGKTKKTVIFVTICLSFLFIGCQIVLVDKPFAPDNPLEHLIVNIDKYSPIDNSDKYFDSNGYMINKMEDRNDIRRINTSSFTRTKAHTI